MSSVSDIVFDIRVHEKNQKRIQQLKMAHETLFSPPKIATKLYATFVLFHNFVPSEKPDCVRDFEWSAFIRWLHPSRTESRHLTRIEVSSSSPSSHSLVTITYPEIYDLIVYGRANFGETMGREVTKSEIESMWSFDISTSTSDMVSVSQTSVRHGISDDLSDNAEIKMVQRTFSFPSAILNHPFLRKTQENITSSAYESVIRKILMTFVWKTLENYIEGRFSAKFDTGIAYLHSDSADRRCTAHQLKTLCNIGLAFARAEAHIVEELNVMDDKTVHSQSEEAHYSEYNAPMRVIPRK